MPKPKQEATLDPWIIEEIKRKKQEKEEREREKQPQIDLPENDMPYHDPEERRRWEEEEERKRKDSPGGVEKIDLL